MYYTDDSPQPPQPGLGSPKAFAAATACLFLVLVLLSGCASAPASKSVAAQTHKTAQDAAKIDIALYTQAISALNDNQLATAEQLFNAIVVKHPELAGPWANLALIDIKNNDLKKAQENLDRARALDPSMPQIYNMLGYIEKKQGNINKAIDYYLQAIAKKPDYAMAHYNVALLYDQYLQDLPHAIEHYKQYLALTHNQDKKTADWVSELENTLKRGTL